MASLEERVRAAVARVERHDEKLGAELDSVRQGAAAQVRARSVAEGLSLGFDANLEGYGAAVATASEALALETIVLRTGRPVLAVVRGAARLDFRDAESEIWRDRLTRARDLLAPAIESVGRIELVGHPFFSWVGTGWLVDENVVVTNRHVAQEFARSSGAGFVFRRGPSGDMQASIDFLEEVERADDLSFGVERVLHIESDEGPDVAFLKIARDGRAAGSPIRLAGGQVTQQRLVAVLGYPARDSRIPDVQLMDRIFGDVYDKKRLAPGMVIAMKRDALHHDCSTLGGNSGSSVIDLETGEALGLHFAGRFLEANYAVPANVVAERLQAVWIGRPRRAAPLGARQRTPEPAAVLAAGLRASDRWRDTGGGVPQAPEDAQDGEAAAVATVTCTIPLHVAVQIGTPVVGDGAAPRGAVVLAVRSNISPDGDTEAEELAIEAPHDPAAYADRDGYDPRFLGDGLEVPLPTLGRVLRNDVLTFELGGKTQHVLTYRHFSVVMSRSRRLCYFSASNVDGGRSRRLKRVGWRYDSRIPTGAQILKECYGNPPKFSRGHMTRREDPVWGAADESAQGNADSMHATNVVPQMQPFNAGIWLGLEDYALENAREDAMRISVFTGPFFTKRDPVRDGVRIPESFWKVIAFVHDETGELCATGYTMSQRAFLSGEEFVFGQHETTQTTIAAIEQRTGLSFGALTALDPLAAGEEALAAPLIEFSQIRFVAR